jgi:hypothetical protein
MCLVPAAKSIARMEPVAPLKCSVGKPQLACVMEDKMGRGLLLWLIGIPLPIILLIWLFGGLS